MIPSTGGVQGLHEMYAPSDHQDHMVDDQGTGTGPGSDNVHFSSLLCNLSILKGKVHQVESVVSILLGYHQHHQQQQPESSSIALASMGTLIQEIIVASSSMMLHFQQMALVSDANSNQNFASNFGDQGKISDDSGLLGLAQLSMRSNNRSNALEEDHPDPRGQVSFFGVENLCNTWYGDHSTSYYNHNTNSKSVDNSSILHENRGTTSNGTNDKMIAQKISKGKKEETSSVSSQEYCDIIELDAADLLAQYTHYCQVCRKGFKRDANLRMHMRAHGDEYKSSAALTKKTNNGEAGIEEGDQTRRTLRKYSCPQEGCRWNRKHNKFQPLKSMICVKNHYKRSHCPKMYVCKRCNRKQFSVLSDLRTHEKHCGDLKWVCSCGTTFSRKDKLMGHVALFVGHTPIINNNNNNHSLIKNNVAVHVAS